MLNGTINDITNLKFYSDNGYEIPMQKQYILTWEIIPNGLNAKYTKKNPSGYFIGDVDLSDETNIKILKNTLQVGYIDNGSIMVRYADQEATDEHGQPILAYSDTIDYVQLWHYAHKLIFSVDNDIRISINIDGKEYSKTFGVSDIFAINIPQTDEEYKNAITVNRVYSGNNTENDKEYYDLVGIQDLVLREIDNEYFVQKLFEQTIPNLGLYFPFVRYSGVFYQDKISSGFIAANTILVLEEFEGQYVKPFITSDNNYSLVFQPTNESELKIISADSLSELKYDDSAAFSLADEEQSDYYVSPLSFAIGVQAEVEGAYQNFLGIYMRSLDNTDIAFFMGCLIVKTEVEGEDERFRTLLDNFGVVDPIKYPNLFAEQDYQEEGKDYTLINKKSKELMLTYDQIFSYVGTYKALLGAIKFLGYNDIVFKEWYTLRDANDKETDVAVQIFDSESGNFLKQKLADYGVSIEDFKSYNKINKLSMIYHMNEVDDNYEYIDQHLVRYKKATYDEDGNVIDPSTMIVFDKYTKLSEVPLTKPIYLYRNEETLAKLFAVKHWLETNVIGVNAYISDISGEGVYFGWQKSQIYSTQHYLTDYSQEQYYTADVKEVDTLKNSSANIVCTLTELNNGVKFCEYENVAISAFDKVNSTISMTDTTGVTMDISTLIMTNTIEAPVLGDEYEFDLMVKPDYGTLCEWTVDGKSQILYNAGELNLLFDEYTEAVIDSSCLPIITIENANIHKSYGDWKKNIEWSIKEVIDQNTGNVNYRLKNFGAFRSSSYAVYDNNYFVLVPNSTDAYIKYSENNKYQLPMFIIKGYQFDPILNHIEEEHKDEYTLDSSAEYILEILKGDMLFKQVGNVGAQLSFSNDKNHVDSENQDYAVNTYEQEIGVQYTYHSDKKQFTYIDANNIVKTINESEFDYENDLKFLEDDLKYIESYYHKIIQDRSDFIVNPNKNVNLVAFDNARTYCDGEEFNEEISKFIEKKKEQKIKELLHNDFISIYNDNYTFNSSISVNVNRLGKYDVICRAYDKYNNIFTNKYAKQAEIISKPISIDLYTLQESTNNKSDFYRFNTEGVLCSSNNIVDILSKVDDAPKFPKNYHIYDFDYDSSLNRVEFDNLSYAIDTPKNNDYVIFDNLSELCTGAEPNGDETKLVMLDENPKRVYLYNPNTDIKICVFDKLLQKDKINIGPYRVNVSFKQEYETDMSATDDSYLIINSSLEQDVIDMINDRNHYSTYVLNVTEHELCEKNIYSIDYENKTTTITFREYYSIEQIEIQNDDPSTKESIKNITVNIHVPYRVFNDEDVIKVRYYDISSIQTNEYTDETKLTNIINETSYRIINSYIIDFPAEKYEEHHKQYVYVINGLINEFMCSESNIKVTMSLATHNSVHYVSRVVGDAREYNYNIDNGNYIMRDRFNYDSGQMLLNDYIDDTYSGIIYDYDATNLKKIWFNPNDTFDPGNMDLYYYHDFPISVPQGKQLIYHHHDIDNVLKPGYHVEWKVSNYTFDDVTNWHNHKNTDDIEILFRSINDYLPIKPEYLGSQDIELECIDIYGNRVVNSGSGLLYINENETYVNTYIPEEELIYNEDPEEKYKTEYETEDSDQQNEITE